MSFVKQAFTKGAKAFHRLANHDTRAKKSSHTTGQETGKSIPKPHEDVPKSSDSATSSAAITEAEQDGHAPESLPRPNIDKASGNNQLVLPVGLFGELQKAAQAHIEMRDCEREAGATARILERRLDALDEQRRELAGARANVMKPKSESCIDLQRELRKCLREKEKVFRLLEKIEEYLHEDHENYRERTEGFFEMWHEIANQELRGMRCDGDVVLLPSAVFPAKKANKGVQAPSSDVDDGYPSPGAEARRAENPHGDPESLRWLAGDDEASNELPGSLDSWPARSIAIWESASMVAEGDGRRRIDRWEEHLEELRKQG